MTTPTIDTVEVPSVGWAANVEGRLEALEAWQKTFPPPPTARIVYLGAADLTAFTGIPCSSHRTYFGVGSDPSQMAQKLQQDKAYNRWSYVSIGRGKGLTDWPTSLDQSTVSPFVTALQSNPGKTVLIPHHEPENDAGTPANFQVWTKEVSDYFKANVPGLLTAICLMAWTIRNDVSAADKWINPDGNWDKFCIDGYAHDNTTTASNLFSNALVVARNLGIDLSITETGINNNLNQGTYLDSLVQFVKANSDIDAVMYWNSTGPQGTYTLNAPALSQFAGYFNNPPFAGAGASPV